MFGEVISSQTDRSDSVWSLASFGTPYKPHKDKYQNHIVDDLTRPRPRPGELINV